MKLLLNTAYGCSIIIYDKKKIIYQFQDLNVSADNIFQHIKKSQINFKNLKQIILIDGPGSQIGMKVGEVCIKPILLIYSKITLARFSYFDIMTLYLLNIKKIDISKGLLLAIGLSSRRFYCLQITTNSSLNQNKSHSITTSNSVNIFDSANKSNKNEFKLMKNIEKHINTPLYAQNMSYTPIEIEKILLHNNDIILAGHQVFAKYNQYIKEAFPLSLNQLNLTLQSLF